MSSVTQYRITSAMEGVQVLDLMSQLGEKGYALLEKTLQNNESGWHLVPGNETERVYRHEVVQGMPAGVTSPLVVNLHLRGGIAQVTHQWTYQNTPVRDRTAERVPAETVAAMNRMVGRLVNTVLMHTVANELKHRIESRPRVSNQLRQTLDTYVRNPQEMQLHVKMRQRSGQ